MYVGIVDVTSEAFSCFMNSNALYYISQNIIKCYIYFSVTLKQKGQKYPLSLFEDGVISFYSVSFFPHKFYQ